MSSNVNNSSGKLIFDPMNPRIKSISKNWIILKCDDSIIKYYQSWLYKQSPFINKSKLEFPPWGAHISVVRGGKEKTNGRVLDGERVDPKLWEECKKEFNNRPAKFVWDENIQINERNGYTWLICASPELSYLRIMLGLSKFPTPNFHITLGKIVEITSVQDILNNQEAAGKIKKSVELKATVLEVKSANECIIKVNRTGLITVAAYAGLPLKKNTQVVVELSAYDKVKSKIMSIV